MNPDRWLESGEYFDFKGHRIFFRRTADEDGGEILLCLHGFPTSSYDYHKVWPALGERFSLVAFDLIGYGFSAKPVRFDYTTAAQADLLQTLIEQHLQIERLHILAHDYGNTITQELLARDKEKRLGFQIESICFLNGALFPETHRPILAQKILLGPAGPLFGRLIPDRAFGRSLASVFGEKTRPDERELAAFIGIFKHNRGRRIAHKLIRYMRERERYRDRWVGALEQMQPPFRFINGLADPVSGRHLVKRFREILPGHTDIVELEEVGHFPHFEVPEVFLRHFFEFHQKNRK